MQLISIAAVKEDMVLGKTIWNDAGHPLLQEGATITSRIIQRLEQLNIQYIYVDTALSKGIEIEETVSVSVRNRAVKDIKQSFDVVRNSQGKNVAFVLEKQAQLLCSQIDELIAILSSSEEALTVLSDAFLYDEYIYQHSFQVALYSLAIAQEMHYNAEEMKIIGLGALLHDIGKIAVPHSILQKPGKLTDDEYEQMKEHARYGFELLRNLYSVPLLVAHCAFQHHERLDGSGYPRGITEKDIHPYAKIVAVADVFDALSSNRVYRSKLLPVECLAIIEEGSGVSFDKKVVEALKRSVVHYPNGTIVRLNDARVGIVVRQNTTLPLRPNLRIFEEQGERLKATYELNLLQAPQVKIITTEPEYIL